MRCISTWLTALGLLTAVATAQPAPPADAPSPPPPAVPPTPPEPQKAPAPVAGFDKGFFLRSDDGTYSLVLTGRVQPFYNLTRSATPNAADPDDDIVDYRNQFEVRRARLVLDGNLHGKALTYKFQTDFGRGVVSVRDVHFDLALAKDVWLRFGQWKRPFSRQQINSSGRLEITDRAITDRAFGAGRDVGIALRNNYEKSPELEWTLGVFNGTGEAPRLAGTVTVDPATGAGTIGTTTNTNVPSKFKPAVIGRVGINRNGLKGYSEADLEGGPLRFGVAASIWLEGDFDDDDRSNHKVEVDYIVKAEGLSTTGGIYAMTDQDGDSVLDAETSLVGFHVQAGYMANKHWQPAARFAWVNDPRQKAKTARDQQEISLGVNYYGAGHDAKFAGAVRLIKSGDASFADAILFELGANIGW
ncbi:MAG: hypothetical protein H0T42_07695 [Deltaproteobacteria bacterium]|nr:hypothetical protein [Deltaproteobacteria bacterium]